MKLSELIEQREKELRRLYNGCCPVHNQGFSQMGVAFTAHKPLPRPYADIVGCNVKDCKYREVIDNVNSPSGKARPRKQLKQIIAGYKRGN